MKASRLLLIFSVLTIGALAKTPAAKPQPAKPAVAQPAVAQPAVATTPTPKPPDLSDVSEDSIIKTVERLQKLVKDAETEVATAKEENKKLSAKADDTLKELATEHSAHEAAKQEITKVQGIVDGLNAKVVALTKERDAWKKRAVWLMMAVSLLAAIAALRFTKMLPVPWNYVAAVGVGSAVYGALYAIL